MIRSRSDASGFRLHDVWVITQWPDSDTVMGGPYQSLGYSVRQAQALAKDASIRIWRDHARPGHPEALEQIEI